MKLAQLFATILLLPLATISAADGPVEITANSTRHENGTVFAEGKVTLHDGAVILRCDRLENIRCSRLVLCFGPTEAEIHGITIALNNASYEADKKRMSSMSAK